MNNNLLYKLLGNNFFRVVINPLFLTLLFSLGAYFIQLNHGANLAFFRAEVIDGGRKEICEYGCAGSQTANLPTDCFYYGGCLKMIDSVDTPTLKLLLLLFIGSYCFIINFFTGKLFLYNSLGLILSILVFWVLQDYDWFNRTKEFIGLSYLFSNLIILPILLAIFFTSFFLNKLIFKISLN